MLQQNSDISTTPFLFTRKGYDSLLNLADRYRRKNIEKTAMISKTAEAVVPPEKF
jgi:hypothetical protein